MHRRDGAELSPETDENSTAGVVETGRGARAAGPPRGGNGVEQDSARQCAGQLVSPRIENGPRINSFELTLNVESSANLWFGQGIRNWRLLGARTMNRSRRR